MPVIHLSEKEIKTKETRNQLCNDNWPSAKINEKVAPLVTLVLEELQGLMTNC